VKEFIAFARARPGKLDYGSPGIGSPNHLAGELAIMRMNVKLVHVPFKGSGEAVVAAASGMVPVSFPSIAGALPLLESKRLRPLAVTSAKRVSLLPALPTM
jgi:tripartite-type tricarboxylate transporter receptor subunit TctC